MIWGTKYSNPDLIYITFKKHPCPNCKTKLKTVKVSKVINYHSPEAKDYSFAIGNGIVVKGNVKFIWKEFECPNCKSHYTVNELKKIEGVHDGKYPSWKELLIVIALTVLMMSLLVFLYITYKTGDGSVV